MSRASLKCHRCPNAQLKGLVPEDEGVGKAGFVVGLLHLCSLDFWGCRELSAVFSDAIGNPPPPSRSLNGKFPV
ncbi:unnamed protein product [Bursaphelenchus xylophilus]|uniref:(pine wood nematode) hypothetical protein n=1 Tax=Bursaphelenchus xylophilus TaxID=6326 RepID=A0A7I8WTC3_BURXY|nr:unnamed protein product [Bursaphelenchus xylophilus]CAG9115957.1 unnamed protein product [Bursaphelenchus xylophilus]